MNANELIKELQKIVANQPEVGEYEVAQQDCFSAPRAFTGTNLYVGTYYDTESGGYLDPDEIDEGEEIEKEFPVLVIESF